MKQKILKTLFFITFLLIGVGAVTENLRAEVLFHFDAEDENIGITLPNAPGNQANFCQTECSGSGERGTIQSAGGAPQGANYFQWLTVDSQPEHYTQISSQTLPLANPGYPVSLTIGKKYYLAYYMRFDRIGGIDIWHEGTGVQSADKDMELYGDGLRVILSRGQWDKCDGVYSPGFGANLDHKFTIWSGNWGTSINQTTYYSGSGYSCTNPPQLDYETWHAVVMAVDIACDENGSVEMWLNGQKIIEQLNVQTVTSCTPTLTRIQMGGTIAQPDYDAPPHYRKFDDLLLSDDWQDIVNGNYLQVPFVSDIIAPSAPGGLNVF